MVLTQLLLNSFILVYIEGGLPLFSNVSSDSSTVDIDVSVISPVPSWAASV